MNINNPNHLFIHNQINCGIGSLATYIQIYQNSILRSNRTFKRLLDICLGICDGMAFLESHRIIHKDLACRNCLVGSGEVIKICDFGMAAITTRNVYQAESWKLYPGYIYIYDYK